MVPSDFPVASVSTITVVGPVASGGVQAGKEIEVFLGCFYSSLSVH